MIVRLMGEGQYEVDDEVAKGLNGLDEQAGAAVEQGDEQKLHELLQRMADSLTDKKFGEDDIALVNARGALAHPSKPAGANNKKRGGQDQPPVT